MFMSLGNKIYEMRIAKKLSQSELADLLDVSRQSVSKWETNAAVPELDKLVKLCDVFEITLDEMLGRHAQENPVSQKEENGMKPFGIQKIMGCILLCIAVIGLILTVLLADHSEDLYILIPLLFSVLLCALICLCVKRHCGYYCAWSVLASFTVLTPNLVNFPMMSVIGCFQLAAYIIMGVIASRVFDSVLMEIKKIKTAALILGWIIGIAVYILTLVFLPMGWITLCIVNFSVFFAMAVLLTYTVCYIKNIKRSMR